MNLKQAVVIVTGAATGVGRALAREAARRGARVVAADIHDAAETVQLVKTTGGEALACVCDVTDQAAVQNLIAFTLAHYGQINMICANAGSSFGGGTLDKVTVDDMRRTFELSVFSVLNTVQAALPHLKKSAEDKQAAVILITGSEHSLSAPTTAPPLISYTSAKHALVGFVACARRDLAGTGVQVHLLCPGWVRTENLQGYASQNAVVAQALSRFGQDVDEVARAAFAGVDANALIIPTNPASRSDGVNAHTEILNAVSALPLFNPPA